MVLEELKRRMVSLAALGVIGQTTRPLRFVRSRTCLCGLLQGFFVFAVREVDLTTGSGFSFDFEEHCVKELGVQDPVGFWDPAGGGLSCIICDHCC